MNASGARQKCSKAFDSFSNPNPVFVSRVQVLVFWDQNAGFRDQGCHVGGWGGAGWEIIRLFDS